MSAARSFSVDLAAPFSPKGKRGLAALLQLPIKKRALRPQYLDPIDLVRYVPHYEDRSDDEWKT